MDIKEIIKSTQEQAAAAWIDYLHTLRAEALIDKLSDQNCNLEHALKAIDEVRRFIADPDHILGSLATKHGEIAEHMQVGFSNAEAAVRGQEQLHTFEGVGRLAMEDYLCAGKMVQSKFYNGTKGSFYAVCRHFNDYPNFIRNGGTYDIPHDQYEKLMDIYTLGETAKSKLSTSEDTLFKAMKVWEAENSVQIKEVIKPAVVGYNDVQPGVADRTILKEEVQVKKIDKDIRQEAIDDSRPTITEGIKSTAVSAAMEGGVTFAVKIYQKKKSGIPIRSFTSDDWKDIGLDTLSGTAKGAIRGSAVYTMVNYTDASAPLANAMVTATFGLAAQARKLSKCEISCEEFVDNSEVICLEVAISALSSMIGNVLIPVPVLGAIIGNAAGMFMYEISKTYLSSAEQKVIAKYQKNCTMYMDKLDSEYQDLIQKLDAEVSQFNSLLELTFDAKMNQRLKASADLAIFAGADKCKILKNEVERDAFFLPV